MKEFFRRSLSDIKSKYTDETIPADAGVAYSPAGRIVIPVNKQPILYRKLTRKAKQLQCKTILK